MISRQMISRLLASLFGTLMVLSASAQGFPNKMVTVMVPYPAGGPSDAVGRLVQVEYEKNLGQKMVIENLGGVSGALGVQKVLAAPADGHYQLLSTPMELVMSPLALSAVKFKPEDVRLASLMGRTSIGLAVRKDIPANNIPEFLAWAKGKQVSYASVGQGSLYHIMGERFKVLTGLNMQHIPYKAGVQIYTDLGGGSVDMSFVPIAGPIIGMVKDNRFKIIGITSTTAHPQLPEAAPISSQKGMSDFIFDIWIGLQVSKNTPEAVIQKLNLAMNEAIKSETFVKGMTTTGSQVPAGMSVAELDKFYTQEVVRYRALFKAANVEPQ
jgi:tripartite-type tricarboxylate transporter receptor subunit TctC